MIRRVAARPLAGAALALVLLATGLLFSGTPLSVAASKPAAAPVVGEGDAIDRLVAAVCSRRLVLLGEDLHHGSGATVAAKAVVAERLIDRCGFSAVLFEGQFYDFLALQRAFDDGTATPRMLSTTIGGLWSPSADFQPFEDFLFERARAGRVVLGGIDPQLGGASQRYSQDRLAEDLFRRLAEPARGRCAASVSTLANWRFDDATPYDDDFRQRVRRCLSNLDAALDATSAVGSGADGDVAQSRIMAKNLSAYLDMAGGDATRRDRAMADNASWYLGRLPPRAKAIVWTASVHAATAPVPASAGGSRRDPAGARLRRMLGNDAASIGFVATSGTYGSHGRGPFPIAPATPLLLESREEDSYGVASFLDHDRLAAAGVVQSRVLDYAHPQAAQWASLFDGILVLREEHPLRTLESPSAPLPPQQRQDSR